MKFVINTPPTKKLYHLAEALCISKQEIQHTIGSDFNKSVANILGLVSLLDADFTSGEDLEDIRRYLSVEATNLNVMVKKLCV